MAEEGETQKPNIAARERGKTKVENSRKLRRKVGSRVGAAPTKLSGVIKSIQNQSAFLLYCQRPFESRRGVLRVEIWNERLLRSKTCVFQTLDHLSNHNSIPLSLYHFCIHEILWLWKYLQMSRLILLKGRNFCKIVRFFRLKMSLYGSLKWLPVRSGNLIVTIEAKIPFLLRSKTICSKRYHFHYQS